jgi:hypothetical protein
MYHGFVAQILFQHNRWWKIPIKIDQISRDKQCNNIVPTTKITAILYNHSKKKRLQICMSLLYRFHLIFKCYLWCYKSLDIPSKHGVKFDEINCKMLRDQLVHLQNNIQKQQYGNRNIALAFFNLTTKYFDVILADDMICLLDVSMSILCFLNEALIVFNKSMMRKTKTDHTCWDLPRLP